MRKVNRTKATGVVLASVLGGALGLAVASEVATPVIFWGVFGVLLATTLWWDGLRSATSRERAVLTTERQPGRSVA